MNCQAQECVLYFTAMLQAMLAICHEGGKVSGPSLVGSMAVQGYAGRQLLARMGPSLAASVAIIGSFHYNGIAKPHTRPELCLPRKVASKDPVSANSALSESPAKPYSALLEPTLGLRHSNLPSSAQPQCTLSGKEKQAPGVPHEDFLPACLTYLH